MQRPLRVVALLSLLGLLALAPILPALAGTAAAPEITDPAMDQKAADAVPTCPDAAACQFDRGDILLAYVEEKGSDLILHVKASADIGGGSAGGQDTSSYTYAFHLTVGTTEVIASAVSTASAVTPGDAASAAARGGPFLNLTLPKSALSASAPGTSVTKLFVTSSAFVANPMVVVSADRAPDGAAYGTDYTLSKGNQTTNTNDADGDGLNDTWEQSHFGGTSETASGDPDGDGCTNACEQARGTDPKKADTDGDGCSDGDEVKAGTDPTKASSVPSNCAHTENSSTTSHGPTSSGSTTNGPTSTGSTTSQGAGGEGSGDSSQRLKDGFSKGAFGVGYLVLATAGAVVVIILALVGRGGRWGL